MRKYSRSEIKKLARSNDPYAYQQYLLIEADSFLPHLLHHLWDDLDASKTNEEVKFNRREINRLRRLLDKIKEVI